MTDFEKISHLIRFGLTFHKMNIATIIEWADQKIIEQTDSDIFFDLSTAKTINKIIELLSEKVRWDYNNKEIRWLILSYYKEYLRLNLENWLEIEKELFEYFHLVEYENGNERTKDFLYFLGDDLDLRKIGHSGLLQMPNYLTENLVEYKDYEKLKRFLIEHGLSGYVL